MLEKSLKFLKKAQAMTEADFPLKLAESGKPTLDFCYALAEHGKDYITAAEPLGNKGACLIAHGDDVVFREFGAGVSTQANIHSGAQGLPPIEAGSWSREHAQQFSEKGYWYYNGHPYKGIAPTMGMQNAFVEIRNNLHRIASEVMNNG